MPFCILQESPLNEWLLIVNLETGTERTPKFVAGGKIICAGGNLRDWGVQKRAIYWIEACKRLFKEEEAIIQIWPNCFCLFLQAFSHWYYGMRKHLDRWIWAVVVAKCCLDPDFLIPTAMDRGQCFRWLRFSSHQPAGWWGRAEPGFALSPSLSLRTIYGASHLDHSTP